MDNMAARVFVGFVYMILILYPLKVFVRWVVGFFKCSNNTRSYITFISLTLIYHIFIAQIAPSSEDIFRGIVSTVPIFLIYLFIDLQKSKENSVFIKVLHHLATRIVVSIISIIIIIPFYKQLMNDTLLLKSLGIYLVYLVVIIRRRKKKDPKLPVGIQLQ